MIFDFSNFVIPLYAGLLGLVYIGLSFWVIKLRRKFAQSLGDGGHRPLIKLIRVHANFSEYVPFTLVLLFLCEVYKIGNVYVHILGSGLFVGRLLHAYGLSKRSGPSFGRFYGLALNYLIIIISSLFLILKNLGII